MIKILIEQWSAGFWGIVYVLFVSYVILFVFLPHVGMAPFHNPMQRLKFIEKAQKENRVVIGKLCCWTTHGHNRTEYDMLEYVYYVDGKKHIVTYKVKRDMLRSKDKETLNPDEIADTVLNALTLFYDKKHHERVISKMDIFANSDVIQQVHTAKENRYRDMERVWYSPIELVSWG